MRNIMNPENTEETWGEELKDVDKSVAGKSRFGVIRALRRTAVYGTVVGTVGGTVGLLVTAVGTGAAEFGHWRDVIGSEYNLEAQQDGFNGLYKAGGAYTLILGRCSVKGVDFEEIAQQTKPSDAYSDLNPTYPLSDVHVADITSYTVPMPGSTMSVVVSDARELEQFSQFKECE